MRITLIKPHLQHLLEDSILLCMKKGESEKEGMYRGGLKIRTLHVRDIRFPTSLGAHGTDAMHVDCNYSAAYVIIYTEGDVEGHGLTFTIGHGNEIVTTAYNRL
ncbi:Mitochondrial enolase superfamily member 1 [Blattella germanica]|nr:Mitochondrial enolase superfamily member 1 [Blattella germanica]